MHAFGGLVVSAAVAVAALGLVSNDANAQASDRCSGASLWDARLGRCVEDPRLRCASGELSQCVVVAEHYRDPRSSDHDLRLATTYYERACTGGEHAACGALGAMALFGEGQSRDVQKALRYLTRACDGHDAHACTRLGEAALALHETSRAITPWTRACELGDARGCVWLSDQTRAGTERCDALSTACSGQSALGCALLAARVESAQCTWDVGESLERTAWACQAGEPEGCFRWARLLEQNGAASDGNPRDRLTWACLTGHVGACATLATWLDEGTFGPRSAPLTETYAQQACDLGSIESCVRLAVRLITRSRSTEHSERVVTALQRGCHAAVPNACRTLGDAAVKGRGMVANRALAESAFMTGCGQDDPVSCERAADVFGYRAAQASMESDRKHDWARASEALSRACRLNRPRACVRFGLLTLNGFTENSRAAYEAMLQACSLGAPDGCLYAGRQLALGQGIDEDRTRALALLQQACTAGSVLACGDFDEDTLTAKMTAGPAFPMPYAFGMAVPAQHRVAPTPSADLLESNVPVDPVAVTDPPPDAAEAEDDTVTRFNIDVGLSGSRGGQAGRLIGGVTTPVTRGTQLLLQVPMVVADADLTTATQPGGGRGRTSASTFRLGNVTLGAQYKWRHPVATWQVGLGLVLPTASAPNPDTGEYTYDDEGEVPTLERQLAVRAYQLALAVDGVRSAWLYRPNMSGLVGSFGVRNTDSRWLLQGDAHLAVLTPLRGEYNGEVVLQLEGLVGRRAGPMLFALRTSFVALGDAEVIAPSTGAIAAFTDDSGYIWSMRATWLPDASRWNVPTWGLSASVGTQLP